MSEKILIAEISENTVWYDYSPFYANVWIVRTNNIYTDIADSEFELENIGLISVLNVLSYQVRKEPYLKVSTVAEVIANQKTFYFNSTDKTLLVHFENHKPFYYWQDFELEIGFALGFFHTNSHADGLWNDVQYYQRLKPFALLPDEKDDLYYGKQKLQGSSIELSNEDLLYKGFSIGAGVVKKNGNFVRTLIWEGDDASSAVYTDFEVVYQGVIEKIKDGKTIKIQLRDLRSSLKVKSPNRYLDTSTYTDIKDPDKNYILNQVWGKCFRVPCLALNEEVNDGGGSTAYEFLICDTINHTIATNSIQDVYINGKLFSALSPTVTFDTVQSFAKFTIPAINFAIDDGVSIRYENMDKVSIDVYGYLKGSTFKESDGVETSSPTDLIENGLAILREIIKNNYGWDYNTTFYDISIWEDFEDEAYSIGYFLNSPKTTQKQIEELQQSQLGKFIWGVDLRFSFDNDDFDEYQMEIPKYNLFPENYSIEVDVDSTQVLANLRVGLKRKWDSKDSELSYEWLLDDSNEETALTDYNSTNSKDFLTLINNLTDAQDFADRVLIFGGISKDTVPILTDWSAKNLKSGEWLRVQLDHSTEEYIGWTKCQIQKVSPKANSWEVELVLRIFAYLNYLKDGSGNFIIDAEGRRVLAEVS